MANKEIYKINDERMTKARFYETIAARLNGETPAFDIPLAKLQEFIANEMAINARKNTSSRKSEAELAQDAIHESLVLDFLRVQPEPRSVTEIWRGIPELATESTSKVTSIVGRLLKADAVVKTVGKNKRSLYSIA